MPFEWCHSKKLEALRTQGAGRREAMYLDEAAHRAALLKRLGFSLESALTRIERHFDFGFELHPREAFRDKVPEVVRRVYAR